MREHVPFSPGWYQLLLLHYYYTCATTLVFAYRRRIIISLAYASPIGYIGRQNARLPDYHCLLGVGSGRAGPGRARLTTQLCYG